ncbi:MAG: PAS domain-containing sensor histidine kinase [Chloroflexota bacterium]
MSRSRVPDSDPRPPAHGAVGDEAYSLLVDTVQDYAIFLISPEGQVLTWNLGAQRIKGYRAEEIIGRHFSTFYTDEERVAGRPMRLLTKATEEGRIEDEGWRVRKDGTHFWADVVVTALHDKKGELYGFAKITRDLTERRAAEEQERTLRAEQRARAAAEEALRARDRFLSIASHELKTPVASVQLATESLQRANVDGQLDVERLEVAIRRVLTATSRLASLVDELLDVSRLNAQTETMQAIPTDVVALVTDVVERFSDLDGSGRVSMDAPAQAWAKADASRLDQVFTNLVDNALKYSPPGSPVGVQISDRPDEVEVVVRDEGIGIDPIGAERLFDAFGRGTNAENIQGMGLGLYISQRIVAGHGGRIEGRPRAGGGAEFTVTLPK